MKHRIVTISRQFGSGGRTIGRQLAQQLGTPCYDHELIVKMAEQSGFTAEYVAENQESAGPGSWLTGAFSGRSYPGFSNQDYLWKVQRQVILELAEQGPCVIVGRGADYILRDQADCLRVFIHADMETRAHRIVAQYGEREQAPEKRLRDKDKRRAAYYQLYTDRKWGAVENYDITLNSGVLGLEQCVAILAQLYKAPHADGGI